MRLQDVRFKSLSARLGAGLLGVVLGTCAMGMAQDQPKDEARPQEARPEEARPQDARPEGAKPQEAKPQEARPQEAHPAEARPQQGEARPSRDQAPGRAEEGKPANNGRDDHAAGADHATRTSDELSASSLLVKPKLRRHPTRTLVSRAPTGSMMFADA